MKILLGLLCFICAGCASVSVPKAPEADAARVRLHATDEMTYSPSGSVSSEAAARIACEYFHTFFGDCGGIGAAEDRKDVWAFPTAVGFAGTKGRDILVAKSGTCVFVKGGAVVFWIDGRWRYDRTKYRGFFDVDLPGDSGKRANPESCVVAKPTTRLLLNKPD